MISIQPQGEIDESRHVLVFLVLDMKWNDPNTNNMDAHCKNMVFL